MVDVDRFLETLGLDPAEISDEDYIALEKSLEGILGEQEEADDAADDDLRLTAAIAEVVGDEIEFVDPSELVAELSKAVAKEMGPLRDEVRQVRKLTGLLRKSVAALEQDAGPYAHLRDGEDSEGADPTREEVVEITQTALRAGIGNLTATDAANMQRAAGTETWDEYAGAFKGLVELLREIKADGDKPPR